MHHQNGLYDNIQGCNGGNIIRKYNINTAYNTSRKTGANFPKTNCKMHSIDLDKTKISGEKQMILANNGQKGNINSEFQLLKLPAIWKRFSNFSN